MASLLVQSSQPTHPACDLCYARKIKCDRNDPCGNCVDSKAKCLRTRPKRVGRPRQSTGTGGDGKTESMIDRLSRLESSVTRLATILSNGKPSTDENARTSPAAQQDGPNVKGTTPHSQTGPSPSTEPRSVEDPSDRPSKRLRIQSPVSPVVNGPKREADDDPELNLASPSAVTSEHDFSRATQLEARSFIQGALADTSQNISVDRRSVLEAALEFIGQMEHPPTRRPFISTDKCAPEVADCLIPPSPEFIHMVLSAPDSVYVQAHDMEFTSYVSRATLERMAVALYLKSEDELTLIQYSVCVNGLAANFLLGLPESEESVEMQQVLESRKEDYLRRCLTSLKYITILERPSLTLLQALLTGVTLLQQLGDTPRGWLLASNACRICVALGLHNRQKLSPPSDQLSNEEKELRACYLWCYIFDKGLAMSLGRPVCMPIWDVPEDILAPIDPKKPITAFIHILLRFAKVQGSIVCDLHYQPTQTNSPQRKEATIASLKRQMDRIQKQITEIRAFPPHSSDALLKSEWISADFIYHSIMTVILRFDTGVVMDAIKREECLDNARKAFIALRNLNTHIETCLNGKSFASFLPWTVLYYPLRPYFVLFCNVVATSYLGDFELMKEFADTLMDLPNLNASAQRLQKLCATLVGLCQPLVQRAKEQHPSNNETSTNGSSNGNGNSGHQNHDQFSQNGATYSSSMPLLPTSSLGPWFQQSMLSGGAASVAGGAPGTQDASRGRTSTSEEMFNALFDVQPSLDWLGSDVFGQGTNWTDFEGGFNMN